MAWWSRFVSGGKTTPAIKVPFRQTAVYGDIPAAVWQSLVAWYLTAGPDAAVDYRTSKAHLTWSIHADGLAAVDIILPSGQASTWLPVIPTLEIVPVESGERISGTVAVSELAALAARVPSPLAARPDVLTVRGIAPAEVFRLPGWDETKPTAKKATAKKSTAKKATAKQATARKSTAKRATAKKSTAKKATAKKSTAKRATAKNVPATASVQPLGRGPLSASAQTSEGLPRLRLTAVVRVMLLV